MSSQTPPKPPSVHLKRPAPLSERRIQVITTGPAEDPDALPLPLQVTGWTELADRLMQPRPVTIQRAEAKHAVRMQEAYEVASGQRKNGRKGQYLRKAIDEQVASAKLQRKKTASLYRELAEGAEGAALEWHAQERQDRKGASRATALRVTPTIEMPPLPVQRPMSEHLDWEFREHPERFITEEADHAGVAHDTTDAPSRGPSADDLKAIHREARFAVKGERNAATDAARKKARAKKLTAARVKKYAARKKAAALAAPER